MNATALLMTISCLVNFIGREPNYDATRPDDS